MRTSQLTGACAGIETREAERRCCSAIMTFGSSHWMQGCPDCTAACGVVPAKANCAPRWLQRRMSLGCASAAAFAPLWLLYESSMYPRTGSMYISCERNISCDGRLAVSVS